MKPLFFRFDFYYAIEDDEYTASTGIRLNCGIGAKLRPGTIADLRRFMAFPQLDSPLLTDNTLLRQRPSAFWRLTRRAKRPQPSHDVFHSHFPHLGILSILRQRCVTLDHGDQKAGSLLWIQVTANCSFGLSSSQEGSYSLLPGKENSLQALAKLLVHRRHLRCQIEERTTGSNVYGPY